MNGENHQIHLEMSFLILKYSHNLQLFQAEAHFSYFCNIKIKILHISTDMPLFGTKLVQLQTSNQLQKDQQSWEITWCQGNFKNFHTFQNIKLYLNRCLLYWKFFLSQLMEEILTFTSLHFFILWPTNVIQFLKYLQDRELFLMDADFLKTIVIWGIVT